MICEEPWKECFASSKVFSTFDVTPFFVPGDGGRKQQTRNKMKKGSRRNEM